MRLVDRLAVGIKALVVAAQQREGVVPLLGRRDAAQGIPLGGRFLTRDDGPAVGHSLEGSLGRPKKAAD